MDIKNINEKLKSSTSLMVMYGILSGISFVIAPLWNVMKFGLN